MKTIQVRYSNGKLNRTDLNGCSLNQAEQIIKQIMPELKSFAGEYTWSIVGSSGQYENPRNNRRTKNV